MLDRSGLKNSAELGEALSRLSRCLDSLGLQYAVIWGVAVIMRGYLRATADVDAVALDLDDRLDELAANLGQFGLHLRDSNLGQTRLRRVVLIEAAGGTGIDLAMGVIPFEVNLTHKAQAMDVGTGQDVPIASVEDLLVMKLIALRDRDKDDVMRLMELYPDIDRETILATVTEFAEALESPETVAEARRLLKMPA
ncbi:MAG: hypothetical protein AMXMBFR81_19420 [Chthonomonas sp.]